MILQRAGPGNRYTCEASITVICIKETPMGP
jgi:hypothetical protein